MFIYGKNFFENTDKVYTDIDEFDSVNDLTEAKTWIETNVVPEYASTPSYTLSANQKLVLMQVDWKSELDHVNAKTTLDGWSIGSDHNFIRVTEELFNEYS